MRKHTWLGAFLVACVVLNAGVLFYTSSSIHRLHVHLRWQSTGPTSVDGSRPKRGHLPQNSLKLDFGTWLAFAQQDAALHGLHVSASCSAAHGLAFLEKFKGSRSSLCGGDNTSSARSSVECCTYPVEQLGMACWAPNLVVNTTAFLGPPVPKGHQEHLAYLPSGVPGSVQLGCAPLHQPNGSLSSARKKEQLPWFTRAAAWASSAIEQHCGHSSSVVQHAVMFVTWLDTTNPYHHMQSVIQAFLTLAVISPIRTTDQGLQVVIADHFETGPLREIWQRLSNPHPVALLTDTAFSGPLTCFKHSVHAHYVRPGKAFLGYEGVGSEHSCPSTLLMAFAHWQRYLFQDLLPAAERREYEVLERQQLEPLQRANTTNGSMPEAWHGALPQHRRLNVVWLSRSWFSRTMKAGGGLTGWQASRDMSAQNEIELVSQLEQAVLGWNNKACVPPVFGWWQQPHSVPPQTDCKPTNVSFNFRFMELSVEDLQPDQLLTLSRTAVLVGVHGAALANQIWMRPHRGAVVEFGAASNFHYRNMAFALGHRHFALGAGEPSALVAAVQQAMDHVSTHY